MAEGILYDLAGKIVGGLGSLLVQEIGLASGVKKELRKLEESLSTIHAVLLDAETKTVKDHVVKDWLRKLKEVVYDAEDVLDEFATEALRQKVELPNNVVVKQVRRCFSSSNPLVFRLKMAHNIKNIMERLDCIQKDADLANKFQIKTQNVDINIIDDDDDDGRQTYPDSVIESEVLGRKNDKENLVKLLTSHGNNEENVMVIPIIGIGGLGKTTLAQCVYKDGRVETHFELQMWLCVSFDFKALENKAKSELREKVSGKRYLLVLDDVWIEHPGKWENLRKLLIGGASRSVILVTTRSHVVASIMQPVEKYWYTLEGLNKNDCESLFSKRAFGNKENEANHPELVKIGKNIAKKCGGVPLAAKALGGLLCYTRNIKDWLDVLNTEIWNLDEQEILPALSISYNYLPSHLKQCFAYCSIFPEDHEIDVDDLIHQWMAHGFVQPSPPSPRPLEDVGYRYFRELLWRSFFQEAIEDDELGNIVSCKMHDLVHNLARRVAGREWSEQVEDQCSSSSSGGNSSGSRPLLTISIRNEGVRHMGLVLHADEYDKRIYTEEDKKAKKLRTFCVRPKTYRGWMEIRSAEFVLSAFRGLRVLGLSGMGMKHVPSSIGYLKQLRYLDLSRNHFEALPNSICMLYNLQTLRLVGCQEFKDWPHPRGRDMRKMVSLRHLELDPWNSKLKYMPRGLGQLSCLQTLGYFYVGEGGDGTAGVGELHALNHLRGILEIRGLGNVRDPKDAEEAKLKDKSELQSLTLEDVEQVEVLENLQPPPNLKALNILFYDGVEMPRWMMHSSSMLPNLVTLKISRCSNLKSLPLIGEFPCLRRLSLRSLNALESICNKVVVSLSNNKGEGKPLPLVLFPSLQLLQFVGLVSLKRWTISVEEEATTTIMVLAEAAEYGEEEEESVAEEGEAEHNNLHLLSSMFPSLRDLSFEHCYRLTTLPILSSVRGRGIEQQQQFLTSLRNLEISHLDSLESLPDCPAPATLEKLSINNCPSLVRLPDCFFENLKSLSKFKIRDCDKLAYLPEGIRHLTALQSLKIRKCPHLETLPDGFLDLASRGVLKISGFPNLSFPRNFPDCSSYY